jgi:hypothetical protein
MKDPPDSSASDYYYSCVLREFLEGMAFDLSVENHSPRNMELESLVTEKLADLGLSTEDFHPMAYLHQPCTAFADICHESLPTDFKVFVAVYTILTVGVDDLFIDAPEIQSFTLKFGRGESQGHPHLECLTRLLTTETPKFFGPCGVNFIISSTLDAVNGLIVESMFPHGFPRPMRGFSSWMRAKNGYGEAFGYFIFPDREFPEEEWLGRYIRALPNLRDIICYINDVISFYKERVLRKENSLISNLAEENDCGVNAALKDLCVHTVTLRGIIRDGFAEDEKLLDAFDAYIRGYIKWHFNVGRYKLDQLGLELVS